MICLLGAGLLVASHGAAHAAIVTTGLSIHYRADDVDGLGNPGTGATTTLVNLANPGTNDGTIVNGSGVVQNVGESGPYDYGVVLTGHASTKSHITTSYQVGGGVNKVTDATWEYWLKADSGPYYDRGSLYGEFQSSGDYTRHYLSLQGIGTGTRRSAYDEYPPGGGGASSDSPLFDTGAFTQIVATKDGNTMTFYKDGVQVGAQKTHSETYGSGGITQTLLGVRANGNESFVGQFNVIRVYDVGLTPTEVQGNYYAELGITPPPPPIKIDPSTLSASTNSPSSGSGVSGNPNWVVDGTGLDDVANPTTHSTGYWTTGWRSADYNHSGYDEGTTPDAEWFRIDLGGQYDVDSINIWNGYEYGTGGRGLNRRLTQTDIYIADSLVDPGNPDDNPANWTRVLDDAGVAMADGVISNYTTLDLGGVTATHLALFDMRSNGTDGWTGRHIILSEIEVFETATTIIPEPSTFAIWSLGLLGLAWFGRRKR